MRLICKQIWITPEQDRAVKRLATHAGVSEAEVVRRALDAWLMADAAGDKLFAGLIGSVDGPPESNHSDIYASPLS